jgi:hypothetical protein
MNASHFYKRVRQKVHFSWNDLACAAGFRSVLLRNRPGVRILIYHGVDLSGNKILNSRFISRAYLEKQLKWLKENCHVVPLPEIFEREPRGDRLTVAITFDDGYKNNLKYALPLLEKYDLHASFFITGIRDAGMDILWPDFIDLASRFQNKPILVEGERFGKNRNGRFVSLHSGKSLNQCCKERPWTFKQAAMEAFSEGLKFRDDPSLADYW